MVSAELIGRRSRVLHDTVINTLGAIARGLMIADEDAVRRRCRSDIAAITELEALRVPETAAMATVVEYAGALGVDVIVESPKRLDAMLDRQPGWRRHEIVGLIVESITNSAKHSGDHRVTVSVPVSADASITVRDLGIGVADRDSLRATLALRALDGMVDVDVESTPGRGTAVTISIPPIESVDKESVLTRAIASMSGRIVPVMLVEFLIVATVGTVLTSDTSMRTVIPAVVLWLLVAAILWGLTSSTLRGGHLSAEVVVLAYIGFAAIAGILALAPIIADTPSSAVTPANLSWVSDAAATICIVIVLVDGRARVYVPPIAFSTVAMVATLVSVGRTPSSIAVVFIADLLLILTVVGVRWGVTVMAGAIERQHRTELVQREEQERQSARARLDAVVGASIFSHSRAILDEVARDPRRGLEPRVRAEAQVEESCLRAMLAISNGRNPEWMRVLEAARSARVVLHLLFFTDPSTRDDARGPHMTAARAPGEDALIAHVVDSLARCVPGESVSVSTFDDGGDLTVEMVSDSVPDGFVSVGKE